MWQEELEDGGVMEAMMYLAIIYQMFRCNLLPSQSTIWVLGWLLMTLLSVSTECIVCVLSR